MTVPHATLLLDIETGLYVAENLKLVPREESPCYRYEAAVKQAERKYGPDWTGLCQIVELTYSEWMAWLAKRPRRQTPERLAALRKAREGRQAKLPYLYWHGEGKIRVKFRPPRKRGDKTDYKVVVCDRGKRAGYKLAKSVTGAARARDPWTEARPTSIPAKTTGAWIFYNQRWNKVI